jgi:ABC-2 type transport system permease protein
MYWIETRRYALNTAVRLATFYLFFLTVFMGAWATMRDHAGFGGSLAQIVVGLVVWMTALRAFTELASRLSNEAAQGTLEQLAMSPVGLGRVLIYQTAGNLVLQVAFVVVLLFAMMATTGQWLHLNLASFLPLLCLTVLSVQGIGFALGGLSLVYKRVDATFSVLQYIFLLLIAVPLDRLPGLRFLPLVWGGHLLRRVMVDGIPLWRLPALDVLFLAAHGAVYFAAGFALFKWFERVARDRGLLGHY